jgi:hypothetical protein
MTFEEMWMEAGDGCWTWNGEKTKGGYGKWRDEAGVLHWADRFCWESLGNTALKPDQRLDHTCHNASCINPAHMLVVHSPKSAAFTKPAERRPGPSAKAVAKASARDMGELRGMVYALQEEVAELKRRLSEKHG